MKIIQGTDTPKPFAGSPAGPCAAPDLGRLDALEKIAKSILQKLQALEERVETVEKARPAPVYARDPAPGLSSTPPAPLTAMLDTEAVKKGLLAKMWKHLNDERFPKSA